MQNSFFLCVCVCVSAGWCHFDGTSHSKLARATPDQTARKANKNSKIGDRVSHFRQARFLIHVSNDAGIEMCVSEVNNVNASRCEFAWLDTVSIKIIHRGTHLVNLRTITCLIRRASPFYTFGEVTVQFRLFVWCVKGGDSHNVLQSHVETGDNNRADNHHERWLLFYWIISIESPIIWMVNCISGRLLTPLLRRWHTSQNIYCFPL